VSSLFDSSEDPEKLFSSLYLIIFFVIVLSSGYIFLTTPWACYYKTSPSYTMPLLANQESCTEQHPIHVDESRVAAQAVLMLRHQQMIKNARAKGKGLNVQEVEEPVKPVVKPMPIVQKPDTKPSPVLSKKPVGGLMNFLSNTTGQNSKKKVSGDLPWCDAYMVSTEMTVATAESESEQFPCDVHAALCQQEDRVESLQKEIESNEDLAQIKYMSRDKVGATAALRMARLQQAEFAQEFVVYQKLDTLYQELKYASFDKDEHSEALRQIFDNASTSRTKFRAEVKVSDGTLLKEIQKMIRKL